MKKRITQDDYIKVNRKASREAEIERTRSPYLLQNGCTSQKKYITVKR